MKSRLFVFSLLASFVLNAVNPADNPEEMGGKFQGDMMLTKEQFVNLEYGPRNGLIAKHYRWPKKKGKVIVHYLLRSDKEFGEFLFDCIDDQGDRRIFLHFPSG